MHIIGKSVCTWLLLIGNYLYSSQLGVLQPSIPLTIPLSLSLQPFVQFILHRVLIKVDCVLLLTWNVYLWRASAYQKCQEFEKAARSCTTLFRWIWTNWKHFHTPCLIGVTENSKWKSNRFYLKCFCLWTMKRHEWVPYVSFNSWMLVSQRERWIVGSCQSVVVSSPSSASCVGHCGVANIRFAVQFLHTVWSVIVLLCRLLEKCVLNMHSDEVCDSIHCLLRVFQNNRFSLPLVFAPAFLYR